MKEEEAPLLIWRAIGIYDPKVEKIWREERYDEMWNKMNLLTKKYVIHRLYIRVVTVPHVFSFPLKSVKYIEKFANISYFSSSSFYEVSYFSHKSQLPILTKGCVVETFLVWCATSTTSSQHFYKKSYVVCFYWF